MKNLRLYTRIVTAILFALALIHLVLTVFFYKEVLFRTNVLLILDSVIFAFLLTLGYLKYLGGQRTFPMSSKQFMILIIVGLSIYIGVTTRSHRRQVNAISQLATKSTVNQTQDNSQ